MTDLEGNIFRIRMFTPKLFACGIVDLHPVDGHEIDEMDLGVCGVGVQHYILPREVLDANIATFVVKGEPVGCAGFVGFKEECQTAGIHHEASIGELPGEGEQTVCFRDRIVVEVKEVVAFFKIHRIDMENDGGVIGVEQDAEFATRDVVIVVVFTAILNMARGVGEHLCPAAEYLLMAAVMRSESVAFRRMGDEVDRQGGCAPINGHRARVRRPHLESVHVGAGDIQSVPFGKSVMKG